MTATLVGRHRDAGHALRDEVLDRGDLTGVIRGGLTLREEHLGLGVRLVPGLGRVLEREEEIDRELRHEAELHDVAGRTRRILGDDDARRDHHHRESQHEGSRSSFPVHRWLLLLRLS